MLSEYVRAVSRSNHLKRIAVSLFNYLDNDNDGQVSFEEMLYKIIPGALKEHIDKMLCKTVALRSSV